jgi:hypothetical protein
MSGIWFSCVQILVPQEAQPLHVYVRHWHVIIPSETQLHLPIIPYDFTFRVLTCGSVVPLPLLHLGIVTR